MTLQQLSRLAKVWYTHISTCNWCLCSSTRAHIHMCLLMLNSFVILNKSSNIKSCFSCSCTHTHAHRETPIGRWVRGIWGWVDPGIQAAGDWGAAATRIPVCLCRASKNTHTLRYQSYLLLLFITNDTKMCCPNQCNIQCKKVPIWTSKWNM